MTPAATRSLRRIKVLHTVVWAFFAGCIIAIPWFALRNDLGMAVTLIGVTMVEVVVLALNRMRCPLTAVAARYTSDRQDNFDIYLPLWLARYNKQVFGSLFVAGMVLTTARWLAR